MKMTIVGLEASSGVSGKTGKAYEIGQIHAIAKLAPPLGLNNVATGSMGTTYACPVAVVKTVAHNPTPFVAEVMIEDVMRFGKREQVVTLITPEKAVKV